MGQCCKLCWYNPIRQVECAGALGLVKPIHRIMPRDEYYCKHSTRYCRFM